MANTAVLISATPNRLRYLVAGDEAGGALVIPAATLLADCAPGPLKEMPGIGSDEAGNDQARARLRLLGEGAVGGDFGTDLTNHPHATCTVKPRSGPAGTAPAVDADVDGVNALRDELNLVLPVDSFAVLEIEFMHTLTR